MEAKAVVVHDGPHVLHSLGYKTKSGSNNQEWAQQRWQHQSIWHPALIFPLGKPKRAPVNCCSSCWHCSPPATSVLPRHLEWKTTARGSNPLDMKMSGTERKYPLLSMDLHMTGLCLCWGLGLCCGAEGKKMRWKILNKIYSIPQNIQRYFVAYFNLISSPQSIGVRKAVFI